MVTGENLFLAGTTVCVTFAHPPRVSMGFLWGLWLPPTFQRPACETNWRAYTVPVHVGVGVSVTVMEGRPVYVDPRLCSELLGETQPPMTLTWNTQAGIK